MPIEHSLSEPDRILEVRFIGDVDSASYAAFYTRLVGERPDAMYYDEVINLLDYTGDVDTQPVKQLSTGAAERDGALQRATTILVTHDTLFDSFAAVLQARFPFRTYKIARSVNEAYRMLAAARS